MDLKIDTKDELLKVISDLKSELSQTREIVDSYKPKSESDSEDDEAKEDTEEVEELEDKELDEISELLLD